VRAGAANADRVHGSWGFRTTKYYNAPVKSRHGRFDCNAVSTGETRSRARGIVPASLQFKAVATRRC
jgi:hypothetical protein